jgi:hypothetical protein
MVQPDHHGLSIRRGPLSSELRCAEQRHELPKAVEGERWLSVRPPGFCKKSLLHDQPNAVMP